MNKLFFSAVMLFAAACGITQDTAPADAGVSVDAICTVDDPTCVRPPTTIDSTSACTAEGTKYCSTIRARGNECATGYNTSCIGPNAVLLTMHNACLNAIDPSISSVPKACKDVWQN